MSGHIDIENRFRLNGKLTKRKILEYLPAMLATNISTLLLLSVDGLVVGNLVGAEALASVSIYGPVSTAMGAVAVVFSTGAATRLSVGMGMIDLQGLLKTRSTIKWLMVFAAVFVALVQIPLIMAIIASFNLEPDMHRMVWSYATGMMIAYPFGLISTIGTYQLQVVGKMKILMGLSVMEGIVNLILDLLFVGAFNLGVAGAGFGTMGANMIRCAATLICLMKKTDVFYSGDEKPSLREAGAIVRLGLPEASYALVVALQNYLIVRIILAAFGESGGAIRGVCGFAAALAGVIASGVQGSFRPLLGLLAGGRDLKGLRLLMKQGIILTVMLSGMLIVLIELFPGALYAIHGVESIPEGGILSLRLFAPSLLFFSLNGLLRIYFSNRNVVRFNTILSIAGETTLSLFAFILSRLFAPPMIWLSYLLTETIILLANSCRYIALLRQEQSQSDADGMVLYMTVSPPRAVDASREIRAWCDAHGINRRLAFRVALCMEEMVAYAKQVRKDSAVNVQVIIRFLQDEAIAMFLDDGECTFLDREEETSDLITSNYGLIKKIAKTVEYRYVLNLNYTVCSL